MRRRLKGLFLVCIMCIALSGCGNSISTSEIAEFVEKNDEWIPINESKTTYYSPIDYHVVVLDDYSQEYGVKYVKLNNLIVDEKVVYYDTEHYCLTTEPIQNN